MTEKAKKWSPETVATLTSIVGNESPVSGETVAKAAEALEVSARSVAAKLRQMDIEVASMAVAKVAAFSPEQTDALNTFVAENDGQLTYKEISEQFDGGSFTAKQVQGKILALELTGMVKPAVKVEAARAYTADEESVFVKMANAGKFIEEIAVTLGKSIASIRGKALSLTRSGSITKIPTQKESHAANGVDAVEELGGAISTMTVAAIAAATDKTERGIKTLLTRRAIKVADYDGAAKAAKAAAKVATVAA